MAKILTDVSIRNLKPGPTAREVACGGARGLYLWIGATGAKSFVVRYRFGGRPRKLTLGRWVPPEDRKDAEKDAKTSTDPQVGDPMSLAVARKLAADAMLTKKNGRDPGLEKRQAKQARREAEANTFEAVATEYMRRAAGMKFDANGTVTFDRTKMRTGHDRYRVLRRQVFPSLGSVPITEIKKSDIVRLLNKIEDGELKNDEGEVITGGPVAADRCLALIRKILNWHAEQSDDFRPPPLKLKPRRAASEQARDRVLNDDELRVIWKVSGEMAGPFAALLRFLLLTAARRAEAAEMTWSEVKDGDWTLPRERNKVAARAKVKDLVRPLSRAALTLLAARPKIEGCEYVFTGDGKRPIGGYTKFKRRFDVAVLTTLREENPKAVPLPNWTLHDLRRTARSLMSRAGVPSEHAEQCLGHVIGGVEGIYNRHTYHPEMQTAYEKLAAMIERITSPPADNIVTFKPVAESA
jgi:integrase